MSKEKKLTTSQEQNSKPITSEKEEDQVDPKVRAVFEKAYKRAKELFPNVKVISVNEM